jgi:hypothetical protein
MSFSVNRLSPFLILGSDFDYTCLTIYLIIQGPEHLPGLVGIGLSFVAKSWILVGLSCGLHSIPASAWDLQIYPLPTR